MGKALKDPTTGRLNARPDREAEALRRSRGPETALDKRPIDTHLERIGFVMDRAIRVPGTDIRFGLDPIIGLLFPAAGDAISTVLSAYIVLGSVRHGLPKVVLARMVFNVAVDYLIGSVPFLGDLFDFGWKANQRNLRLLEQHATGERRSYWSDWAWVFLLLGGLAVFIIGIIAIIIYAFRAAGFGWI
jgi:hypothetical protein